VESPDLGDHALQAEKQRHCTLCRGRILQGVQPCKARQPGHGIIDLRLYFIVQDPRGYKPSSTQ